MEKDTQKNLRKKTCIRHGEIEQDRQTDRQVDRDIDKNKYK